MMSKAKNGTSFLSIFCTKIFNTWKRYGKLLVHLLTTKPYLMNNILKDPMNYKTYLKNNEIISIKLRVIKHRLVDKLQVKDIVRKYTMWRNTVTNIVKLYNNKAPKKLKEKINNNISLSSSELEKLWSFLLPLSRKPHSHPKQANLFEENQIINWYEKTTVWPKRLRNNLEQRWELWNITLPKIRGVYKRKWFKIKKVRTCNWETRSLYNYEEIWAFDDWHYDTKVLADAKSLPAHIYENLKHNKHLPLYEWNIMFVWCRVRFTAYSRWKSSTFWLQFLVLVLSHLRYHWITWYIHMHTDWWAEFFSNSERKQWEWNDVLKELNSDIDCYNPNWDIRKNLIERSHRSDDEEFLIPFGDIMTTKSKFMFHAQKYNDYRNKSRVHSWKGMKNRTPKQKLLDLWIHNADKILDFKVLYLDSYFYQLQQHLEFFYFQRDVNWTPLQKLKTDRKTSIDLITKYTHLKFYAQNVLTYYHHIIT
jgi:hypothetical protein